MEVAVAVALGYGRVVFVIVKEVQHHPTPSIFPVAAMMKGRVVKRSQTGALHTTLLEDAGHLSTRQQKPPEGESLCRSYFFLKKNRI